MAEIKRLLQVSLELVKLLDKAADSSLPEEIAGIVKLHAKLALASAWIPIPGADVAAGAASIWGMYVRINKKIDVPFGENILRTIASGVATNLASYSVALGIGSLLKFIPGIGSLGGAFVMSAAIYALTLTSGYIYLKALCSLLKNKKIEEIDDLQLKDTVNSILKDDSNTIKDFMEEAKKTYKEENK